MSLFLSVRERLLLPAIFLASPLFVSGQTNIINPQGNQYSIPGALSGDQIYSSIALNESGGFVVWEQNGTARTGSEIRAVQLNSSLTKIESFNINKVVKGDQRKPQVQLLKNGDAIFVWESYGLANADIYARILKADGKFLKTDLRVNSFSRKKNSPARDQQSAPVVAALDDGGAMVVWQSLNQDGHMMGIYGQKISADGKLEGAEFLVNETTDYNQRDPAIATLADGNLIVIWISELQRFGIGGGFATLSDTDAISVDVYGRIFSPAGEPLSGELLLNSGNHLCANPSVAALSDGGFTVVWSEKEVANKNIRHPEVIKKVKTLFQQGKSADEITSTLNLQGETVTVGDINGLIQSFKSWEIVGRSFSSEGLATGADFEVNTHTYGDQYVPKIAAAGNDCVVVWTSLGQDGSREGVFGRFLQAGSQPSGAEFRVNNTVVSKQIFPTIASDGSDRFLVTWSSFVAITGCDLFGRKYIVSQQP